MKRLGLVIAAVVLAGCGQSEKPAVSEWPLAPGARVEQTRLEPWLHGEYFRDLMIVGSAEWGQRELSRRSVDLLKAQGWTWRTDKGRWMNVIRATSPDGATFASFAAPSTAHRLGERNDQLGLAEGWRDDMQQLRQQGFPAMAVVLARIEDDHHADH